MGNCLNCGEELSGKYCHNCGQEASVFKYSFKLFMGEVYNSVISLDSAFLRTVKALSYAPGEFVKKFLAGARKNYISPFKFLFFVIAINFAVQIILGKPGYQPLIIDAGEKSFLIDQLVTLSTNLLMIFFMLPLAVGIKIVNKKGEYSFFEYFVFLVYLASQTLLIFITIQVVISFFGITIERQHEFIYYFSIFVLLYGWAYLGFFNNAKRILFYRFVISLIVGIMVFFIPVIIMGIIIKIFS